jgi:DNA-binding NarL/FixJ family response regulator
MLVDDHPIVRTGAQALLAAAADIDCVGEASTGAEALDLAAAVPSDVAVLDIGLPDMSGLVLAGELIRRGYGGRIVIFTENGERSSVQQALKLGARGFVQKRSTSENLVHAIRTVVRGGLFLDQPTAREITAPLPGDTKSQGEAEALGLTAREFAVLRMVAHGLSNKEIAGRLDIGIKSVETYRSRAMDKLSLHSRAQIVNFAMTHGWLAGL